MHWWGLATLCWWMYSVVEYVTHISPFLNPSLLIKGINDSECIPTLWWIFRNSMLNEHWWRPHQCDASDLSRLPHQLTSSKTQRLHFPIGVCQLNGYLRLLQLLRRTPIHHHYVWNRQFPSHTYTSSLLNTHTFPKASNTFSFSPTKFIFYIFS